MRLLRGTGTGTGTATGPARVLSRRLEVRERRISEHDILAEVDRFDAAVATADTDMKQIRKEAPATDKSTREAIDVHREILASPQIRQEARELIRARRVGAEWAVRLVVDQLRRAFEGLEDERFRARFDVVDAVSNRLLETLLDAPRLPFDESFRGAIAVGEELSPLDALGLGKIDVAGFATEHGGPTSHTAIIARELGIPYAFAVRGLMSAVRGNDTVWVDGTGGEVVLRPDEPTTRRFEARRAAALEREREAEAARLEPCATMDGTSISVGANVESASDVLMAVQSGADHIGLVRTELLYLGRREPPGEEEQLADALAILRAAQGRLVTFRTLDIGGEKLPDVIQEDEERNPALGLRGIRLSLKRPDLFRTQLRALYRAGSAGPMQIMLPLVSTVEEVRQARRICAQVCADLLRDDVFHDADVPLGAMIETPSAAWTADHLAAECDFLSVGTNDLIQYAFAADRENEETSYLYQPLHPAMLRALEQIFAAARSSNRPVSVCGDMAADPVFAGILVGLGLRSFSIPARAVPFVKSAVRRLELSSCVELARGARLMRTHGEILAMAQRHMPERPP